MAEEKKKWAQSAFSNAHGQLHRQLNVPEGKKIPRAKLIAAYKGKYGPLAKKRAMPVVNVHK